jgi:chorismate mutase
LLAELKTTQQLRGAPLACTIQLAIGTGTGKLLDRLDALHRNALDVATQSVCK